VPKKPVWLGRTVALPSWQSVVEAEVGARLVQLVQVPLTGGASHEVTASAPAAAKPSPSQSA
jgi:hypothetical protein